jgi:hypothetical protein
LLQMQILMTAILLLNVLFRGTDSKADGWYVCFACEDVPIQPLAPTGQETGIDVGLQVFLARNIQWLRQSLQGAVAVAAVMNRAFPACMR